MDPEFTDEEHVVHCEVAGCLHPALYAISYQGWCARCRAVAYRALTREQVDAEFGPKVAV